MTMPAKNVLLVGPPNPFLENPFATPRLGLLYMGAALRRRGHEVRVAHLQSLAELEWLVRERFDFVGISSTTREYIDAIQILNYFKRAGHPAVVALGGPHATAMPDEATRNGFDVVVTGEADEVIGEILEATPTLPAIVHAGFIKNLNQLTFPDRSLLNEDEPWNPVLHTGSASSLRITAMLLSRGCPYRCTFCGPHFRYRRRSDDNIGAELETLCEQEYQGVIIADDLPFVTEKQVRSFCDRIRPLGLQFRCNFRGDLLTDRIAMHLAGAGCRRLQIGIESPNQATLDRLAKGTSPARNGQAVEICRTHGLHVKAMFMWGLPGDGPEMAREIVDWVARYRPDSIQVSRFTPLPGSPIWRGGYSRRVTDYNALSFFRNPGFRMSLGVSSGALPPETLDTFYEEMMSECRLLTHVDTGLPSELVAEEV